MPTNRDGTFTGDGGFGGGGYAGGETPNVVPGTRSDDGHSYWNGTQWVADPGASMPTGAGGWADTSGNLVSGKGVQDTTGTLGRAPTPGAWGGYGGTWVEDPNSPTGARYDAGQNGRQEAVDRARGLGAAAASRGAYQNDYSTADKFAGMGAQDRGIQQDAMQLTAQTARGENLQSMKLGQSMLTQGAQAQQAAAASTRGGALARAAAGQQVANGMGAYNAQGQTQLDAQRANEMATGRNELMQQASSLRAGDATAQGLNQQQAAQQQANELGQRQLNENTSMGYEAQGQAINNAAASGAVSMDEIQKGVDAAAALRGQNQANKDLQLAGAAVGAGGSLAGGLSNAAQSYYNSTTSGSSNGGGGMDPYSQAVSNSDANSKQNIRGLGSVMSTRYWKGNS